jgi:hypothetical protein
VVLVLVLVHVVALVVKGVEEGVDMSFFQDLG